MNPLKIPDFNIDPHSIVTNLTNLLTNNRQQIKNLLIQQRPTWENLIAPLDDLNDALNQFWAPINHLNSVTNEPSLREAYNLCLPLLSDYFTELGQNKALFFAYQKIKNSTAFTKLDNAQRMVIQYALRDFHLSGIDLKTTQQQHYKLLAAKLASLSTKFSENILDTTNAWQKQIQDVTILTGLTKQRCHTAQQAAAEKQLAGWLLTLDYPCYHDVMTFADSATLREEFYHAFSTRASNQGPHDPQYDNSVVMHEILTLRDAMAKLLGFKHYAELSLQPKMAQSPRQVFNFLNNLLLKIKPHAIQALQNLQQFAAKKLHPWDIAYYSEKLRQEKYAVSAEKIRGYFPVTAVIQGLLTIINKLYNITLKPIDVNTWHADVLFYQLTDENDQLLGGIYFDLFARKNKQGGAWMDELVCHRKLTNGKQQLPIALLTCNFAAATNDRPALLTHEDIITLFHEVGHCLQHLLTKVDYLDISGINNVPWDAVEFPSQFFEAWCWTPESLRLLSCHYQTGKILPNELIDQLIAAKNFQASLTLLRQLEFALFDMHLHSDKIDGPDYIQNTFNQIHAAVAILPVPQYYCFAQSFSHVFSGGYAAGYYSYLWAEVLARDAFSIFKEQGILNPLLGEKFAQTILAAGGSIAPEKLFIQFMGRKPNSNALLEYYDLNDQ